ncbi:DUF6545 domain-containing protein [Micromonospora sp. NPDC092111]|uniref:DUF6545 domain-containing protein n=1 Tax=Micromonospora sp. NPDC092111 TaxID=3364289 RepID=UPI003804C65F
MVGDVELDPGHPSGLLITDRPQRDIILVDRSLPAVTRTQTVLHEVAHLVLDHPGDIRHDHVDRAVEAEAELAADLLYQQLTQAAVRAADDIAGIGRQRWLSGETTSWWADRRSDWHLLHLWMALREGMPDLVIVTTTTATPVPTEIHGSRQRHRTVVEIHEALRALRLWCSPQVHASATSRARRHRLDAATTAAVAEAATIAVALRHRQTAIAPPVVSPQLPPPPHDRHDVRAEARHLAHVERAMRDSPLVAAEIARWAPVGPAALVGPRTTHMIDDIPVVPLPADLSSARSARPV